MACSGCAQRRAAIVEAAKAATRGDVKEVQVQATRFVHSSAADIRRTAIAAAHLRLKRR
jgi:hypothetical protein